MNCHARKASQCAARGWGKKTAVCDAQRKTQQKTPKWRMIGNHCGVGTTAHKAQTPDT